MAILATFSFFEQHGGPQPATGRLKNVRKTSNFWSRRRLVFVRNGSCDDLFLRRRKDVM